MSSILYRTYGNEDTGFRVLPRALPSDGASGAATTCEGSRRRLRLALNLRGRIHQLLGRRRRCFMSILNTLTVLALVVMSFALIVAVPVLYASEDTSGRSNRLILLGGLAWVALVLLNWGMSYFVV